MRHPFTRMNAGRAAGEGCGLKDLLTGKMVLSQGAKCAASRGRSASSHQKTGSIQMGLSGFNFVRGDSGESPGGLVQPQRGKVHHRIAATKGGRSGGNASAKGLTFSWLIRSPQGPWRWATEHNPWELLRPQWRSHWPGRSQSEPNTLARGRTEAP